MRRNQFGFAAEAARVWAWVWDIASDRLHWAISPEGLLGPRPACGEWPDFRDMLHPEDRAGFVAAGRAAVDALSRKRRRVPYEAQFRVVRTDGVTRWMLGRGRAEADARGRPLRMIGVTADIHERREAEVEVRKWADAFEHCAHGIAMGDARTQLVLACNPAFARMLGRSPDEVAGMRIVEVYAPDARAQAREQIEKAERAGRASFESGFLHADGSAFPVQVDLVNVNDAAGRPIYRVATVQDLSERRRVERVTNTFADAIENAAIEMVLCDAQDRIVLVSRAFREGNAARLAWLEPGASYIEYLREGLRRGVPVEAVGEEEAWLARRLAQRRRGQSFEQRRDKDRWVLVTDHRMPDGGMLTSGIDISGQKRAQLALEESERRFRDLAAASGEWFWETDAEHRFSWFSEDIERIAGMPRDWYYGKSRAQLAAAAGADLEQEPWRSHLVKLKRREAFRDLRYEHRTPQGVRWVTTSGVPVFGEDGSFRGYRGTGADISRQVELEQRAENALRDANTLLESRVKERTEELGTVVRELEAFTYSASHDLRAPLGAINGFVHLLQANEGQRLSDDGRKLLGFVEANASRMAQLLEGLLEFSRLGRRAVVRYPVATGALVQEVIRELQPAGSAAIRLGPLPDCAADALLLKQVWINLLGNALKYSRGRSPATIDIGFEDGARAYFVRDNGVGFDMRHAGKLFGVFERLHDESEFEGTGLGLAIVERIVQRHGGRVWADSGLGEGATFYFTLEG